MQSVERVLKTIRHEPIDRVPLNVWNFRTDVRDRAIEMFGSLDAFHDHLDIDMFMAITPPPNLQNPDFLEELMNMKAEEIKPEHFRDPDDPSVYTDVEKLIRKYKGDKAIAVHTWGVVEGLYSFIGVERTLTLMAADPQKAKDLFAQMAAFSRRVAENVCRMGIDVFHISGDVGANGTMIFSPKMWREQVAPFDAQIIEPAKKVGFPLSLHSCGYFMPIIPDLIEMGFHIMHPIQESAGMSQTEVKQKYGAEITINGGLDIRKLPNMTKSEAREYVKDKMETLKPNGGFIFCTGHTLQPDTPLEIVEEAYKIAKQLGEY